MKCPKCGEELVEIVYGLPTVELMEDAKNKKINTMLALKQLLISFSFRLLLFCFN